MGAPSRYALRLAASLGVLAVMRAGMFTDVCTEQDRERLLAVIDPCGPQLFREPFSEVPEVSSFASYLEEEQCVDRDLRPDAPCFCLPQNAEMRITKVGLCTVPTVRIVRNTNSLEARGTPSCDRAGDDLDCGCPQEGCVFRCGEALNSSCLDQLKTDALAGAVVTDAPSASASASGPTGAPATQADGATAANDGPNSSQDETAGNANGNGDDSTVGNIWNWLGPVLGIVGAVIGALGAIVAALIGRKRKRNRAEAGGREDVNDKDVSSESSEL